MSNIVLIDHTEERLRISRQLLGTGHHVVETSDAGLVIQMVNGHINSSKIDAIIINSQLPKIYGSDAVTYFRTTYPNLPLIVILNSPDAALANNYLGMGVKDILIKPIDNNYLLKAVNKVVVPSSK